MSDHRKPPPRDWTFHPFEMAFCGYSGTGKTTLLSRLVPALGMDLAYIKHGVHGFQMDRPGKDTDIMTRAGAGTVFISDPAGRALLRRGPFDPLRDPLDFLDRDGVLVEGHKGSPLPRIIVLDPERAILRDPAFRDRPPLAVTGPEKEAGVLPWAVPYFLRDDIPGIAAFVKKTWRERAAGIPLLGLVLTGGSSARMGRDKAALDYHGEAQADRAVSLLKGFCAEVFVSCRAEQADEPGRAGHPQIHDSHLGLGPLSGILSAQDRRPGAAWLVLACDLPFVDQPVLEALVRGRRPFSYATAFRGHQGLPEPLCAIYEPKSRARFLQLLALDSTCPRKMLINSPVEILEPPGPRVLDNINSPDEREKARRDILGPASLRRPGRASNPEKREETHHDIHR